MFENGRTSGWRSMPRASRMNARRRWIRDQASGYAAAKRRPQVRIREGDPVLDVGREPGRAGRRDDVHLERHPGAELDRGAREDRRAHPLVQAQLVAGVEADPEEGVAEPAIDDLLEHAALLADVQRPVPLRDRLEVRGDEPLDVVADAGRQAGGILDDEPRPAVERAPDPEGDRERVAGCDDAVSRAQEAECRPRPGREHQVARQGHPVPVEQPDRLGLGHARPQAREQAPDAVRRLAGGVLEDRELVHVVDRPAARRPGSIRRSLAFSTTPAGPGELPQRIGDERRDLDPRAVRVGLPAEDADAAAAADPLPRQDLAQRPRAVPAAGTAG